MWTIEHKILFIDLNVTITLRIRINYFLNPNKYLNYVIKFSYSISKIIRYLQVNTFWIPLEMTPKNSV